MNGYPEFLPTAEKPTWTYRDCFPSIRTLKLTSVFCHRDYSIDMHTHDFYEINITVRGRGVHYTDKRHYEVGTGDVVVIPPDSRHGYYNAGGLDVFHVLLHSNYFNKYADDLNALSGFHLLFNEDLNLRAAQEIPGFHIEGKPYRELLALLDRLDELEQETNRNPDRADYLLTYSLTFALIVTLCKEYTKQYSPRERGEERTRDIGIIAVSEYIHKNYAKKITLADLCQAGMMSKTLLCEKFRKYYGQAPLSYVNRYRVLVARNMIVETDKTISEIAQETGFFDVSHFVKTYSKYENESPSALRARFKRQRGIPSV